MTGSTQLAGAEGNISHNDDNEKYIRSQQSGTIVLEVVFESSREAESAVREYSSL